MVRGVDLGTSSVTCLLIGEAAEVLGARTADDPLHTPHPGWADQDPEGWWRATLHAVGRALEGHDVGTVEAIGVSGQMPTLVPLDAEGRPVRPAIAWPDTRTTREVEALHARVPGDAQVSILGHPPATGFTEPSLMWIENHEPDADRRGTQVVLAKVIGSGEVAGSSTRRAADALGLTAGIPVMAGAGDRAAAASGCGLIDPGTMLVSMGSGGQVLAPLRTPIPDPELRVHLICHAKEDRWHLLGAVQNVGLALGWIRNPFGWTWGRLLSEAASVPPGADGLLFLAYLTGERTPHMDPAACGTLWGLTLSHGPAHLARAAIEGETFAIQDAVAACLDVGAAVLAGAPMPTLSPTLAAEPGEGSARYREVARRYRHLDRAVRGGIEA